MDLRVTPQASLANVLAQLAAQTNRLGKLQEQASTGKRLLTPSDDPGKLGLLLATKAGDGRLDTYLTAIQDAQSTLNVSVSALQEVSSLITQARTIAVEGSHATENATSREVLANQIDQLLDRLVNSANTEHSGRFLFAGADSRTRPFVATNSGSTGGLLSVSYAGASQRNAVPIGPRQTVATLYDGAAVFQARERGPTIVTGSTGAVAGTGTDNAVGLGELLVAHTSTSFAPGSGVQTGASSATGDTILGPAGVDTLTVTDTSGTGAFGTIALDGGPPVAFTNADADLKITGPGGDVIFVDASAITAGFNGDVNVTSNGTLSVDGGASSVAINFSGNQVVTDSVTGDVTNINSSGIRRSGTDRLDYRGTTDVFQTLMALRDDLRNTRGLSEPEQLASISQRIEEIDRVHRSVLDAAGEQSVSLQQLESLSGQIRDVQLSAKQLISDLEDADLSQLVVQMQANENLLRLTLAVASSLQDQTLLDFMR